MSSSNQNVATVDTQWDKPNGNIAFIKPIGNGTTTITVTTMDRNYSASCRVTVNDISKSDALDAASKITALFSKIDSALDMADFYVERNTVSGMRSAIIDLNYVGPNVESSIDCNGIRNGTYYIQAVFRAFRLRRICYRGL